MTGNARKLLDMIKTWKGIGCLFQRKGVYVLRLKAQEQGFKEECVGSIREVKSVRWREIEADNEMFNVVSGYPPQVEC